MRLATYRLPAGASDARSAPVALAGASTVRLGDEILIYAADWHGDESLERARLQHPSFAEYPRVVKAGNLHLVVQLGSLFQQAHPDVPVVLNKGRYLVVDLDPERARELAADESCYAVRPLKGDQTVFDIRPPSTARSAPVAWVRSLVGHLARSSVAASLQHLASFPTRYSTSVHYAAAAAWASEQLRALGYRVWSERVAVGDARSLNVIAEKAGHGSGTRGLVLVVAHLDSINVAGGPTAGAPGADDNGSGSAGLLEIARALKDHPGAHDLRFVLFGGEEQGLHGSRWHVARLSAAERARIRAVVNMDMIATVNTPAPAVLIEGAPVSQAVIDGLADAAATYTQLAVQTSLNPYNSDHVPFINAELPAVLTIEGTDSANSNVHTAGDTLEHINYDLMLAILRMNVAFVATTVGR